MSLFEYYFRYLSSQKCELLFSAVLVEQNSHLMSQMLKVCWQKSLEEGKFNKDKIIGEFVRQPLTYAHNQIYQCSGICLAVFNSL